MCVKLYSRFTVDGSYCLSCGSDKKIKLWNPVSGLLLKTYGGHADEVTDVAGSCDSSYIVSSSLDKSIIYWDVATGEKERAERELRYINITRALQALPYVDSAAMQAAYAACASTRTRPLPYLADAIMPSCAGTYAPVALIPSK